jgi:hypothetical protein
MFARTRLGSTNALEVTVPNSSDAFTPPLWGAAELVERAISFTSACGQQDDVTVLALARQLEPPAAE